MTYLLFLGVLLARAIRHARQPGGFAVGAQAACLLIYVQIYDLANVSTIPITRFGFFIMAAASLCLWLASARGREAIAPPASVAAPGETAWRMGTAGRFAAVALLSVAAFLGVATLAVWEDGRRFAAVSEPYPPAADAMAASSYLEVEKFQGHYSGPRKKSPAWTAFRNQLLQDLNALPDNQRHNATRFFVLNRSTSSGVTESGGLTPLAYCERFTPSSIDRLRNLAGKLGNAVSFTCGDYAPLLQKPGQGVFIFLDPPYFSAEGSGL